VVHVVERLPSKHKAQSLSPSTAFKKKRTGRVAEEVERLPCKCKALSSNPCTSRRKTERKCAKKTRALQFTQNKQ
jgi:hypothetical protein